MSRVRTMGNRWGTPRRFRGLAWLPYRMAMRFRLSHGARETPIRDSNIPANRHFSVPWYHRGMHAAAVSDPNGDV
jgi:hypothetical protein